MERERSLLSSPLSSRAAAAAAQKQGFPDLSCQESPHSDTAPLQSRELQGADGLSGFNQEEKRFSLRWVDQGQVLVLTRPLAGPIS